MRVWKTNKTKSTVKIPEDKCEEHNKENTKPDEKSKPTIKLNGNSYITLNVGETYTEQGATANDKEDGDITNKINIF